MAEKYDVFSSSIKYSGIFSFSDFYNFCYEWLSEEAGMSVSEGKYTEKLKGNSKDIVVEWDGKRKLTDYFRFDAKIKLEVGGLKVVEINKEGRKITTNEGSVKISVKGTLVKDYKSKFEETPTLKFLRGIYEKWIIASRIEEFEGKIVGDCNEFLSQAKAYLDLEGKRQ